ncbi:MAG: hypothetical protein RMY29_032560 [Nostoc sp. CreGUA01]|nr:hypothetical protein [Nostoc sp. CreGUA01]
MPSSIGFPSLEFGEWGDEGDEGDEGVWGVWGVWGERFLPHPPTPPTLPVCPMPNAQCPMPQINISLRMMIKRGQKPDRFSYQRVKTGEDESPGYWWRWVLRLGNCSLPFQSRL